MKKVEVKLGKRSYNVYIGDGIIADIGRLAPKPLLKNPIFVITNKTVRKAAGTRLMKALGGVSSNVTVMEIPDSERAKSFGVYSRIISRLSAMGKRSKPTVIALGGGVIGDVSGFAAATYRRGVPYIQVPTTLLAQVDSSVGGKVAIDLPHAKNMVGSFYQPAAVIQDTLFLKTLPKKELRNGLAEVIKYGVINDALFFNYLEKNLKNISRLSPKTVSYVVWKCVCIKARVVERDELDEKGIRIILNFGHTFAHAIESTFSYSKRFTHGEAVSIGMVLACETAERLGMFNARDTRRIRDLLKKADLPVTVRASAACRIQKAIEYDKKFLRGKNRFVLPEKIGSVITVENISSGIINNILKGGA